MTAKRFVKFNITANDDYTIQNGVKDSVTGEWYHTIDNQNATKLCELLNELHEENEKLHDEIFRLRTELAFNRTEKEEHSYSVYDFQKKLEKW